MKIAERKTKRFRKTLTLDSPLVGKLITKLLALSKKRNTRRVARLASIFASTTTLFLLIPFYPVYIVLLFGIALGALGMKYPRAALALGILLSIPSAVHQEIAATPLLVAYLLVCILPLAATTTGWINGFLMIASIELAFIPQLSFLAFLPILIAGLALSARDGAVTGLCASLAVIFLLIIGGPLGGLIKMDISSPISPSFPTRAAVADFKPVSIAEAFGNYTNSNFTNSTDHWLQAFSVGDNMLNRFLNYNYSVLLWVIPALWCISGYLASKAIQWYRKLTSFSHFPASLTAAAFPVAGELMSQAPHDIALIIGAITSAGLAGLTMNIFYSQREKAELTNQASEIGSKLDKTRLTIKYISILGVHIEGYERKLNGLNANINSVVTLCQDRKLNEASALVKAIDQEAKSLDEEVTLQRTRFIQLNAKSQEVVNYLQEAERTVRKAKKYLSNLDVSDEEKELERIQKTLAEAQHLIQTGQLDEASTQLDQMLKDGEALHADVSEALEVWSGLPLWTRSIETKLAEDGKANINDMEGIPPKWKSYVLDRFMKEKEDLGLELRNGTVYLPKTKPLAPQRYGEEETLKEETPSVKPAPSRALDSMVLNYFKAHGGTVSLSKAAKDLNLTKNQLDASIKRLKEKGAIEP